MNYEQILASQEWTVVSHKLRSFDLKADQNLAVS